MLEGLSPTAISKLNYIDIMGWVVDSAPPGQPVLALPGGTYVPNTPRLSPGWATLIVHSSPVILPSAHTIVRTHPVLERTRVGRLVRQSIYRCQYAHRQDTTSSQSVTPYASIASAGGTSRWVVSYETTPDGGGTPPGGHSVKLNWGTKRQDGTPRQHSDPTHSFLGYTPKHSATLYPASW